MSIHINDFNVITLEDFNNFQFDSGFIVKDFDPTQPVDITSEDLADVTSGNISFSLSPTIVDLGSDVNNLHGVYKELQYLSGWSAASLSYTSLKFDPDTYVRNLGASVKTGNKVTPKMYIEDSDFKNITWIGHLIGGGYAAIVLKNAFSTNGLQISTSKDGKGNISVTLQGYMSIADQDTVPAEFYYIPANDIEIRLNYTQAVIEIGEELQLKATVIPEAALITWDSDDEDKATVTQTGKVTGVDTGTVTISAQAVNDMHYDTAYCTIRVIPASNG